MSAKGSKIKDLVQEYLLDEEILRKKIDDPKIEFGFQFSFPPGPGGQMMAVFKPKGKDILIVQIGTQISEPHQQALNDLDDKKLNFFIGLRKVLLLKNLLFRIDVQNFRYEISDQIFLNKSATISKNVLFKMIRKVFSTAAYCNVMLGEYTSGKIKPEDFSKETGADFSLYS